ncbi:MAG TPA: methyltransferase domain-containing protein [Solirubrobacteraceae bacterium]|jgi:SAM-dependent methyltransferase|nr:methyltransferase domain-containing protein [Solirubrobacteraceae bacterium]
MTCPLCGGSTEAAFTTTDRNRALSRERFHYRHCLACGTYYLANVPADLSPYYPADYYGFPEAHELDRDAAQEAPKVALIARHAAPGRLIEIGPGYGAFARAARAAGFDVTGIEMDAACCSHLERVVGVRAIHSDSPDQALDGLEPARAIAMWHVVEHLGRPWRVLAAAAKRLEPGGVLAIAMPNPQSLQFRLLRGRWAHVDAPRHLFLFPYPVLRAKLEELGLEVLEVTSSDPVGIGLNRLGWEYAVRRFPARRAATRPLRRLSAILEGGAAPLERRDLSGAAYTLLARNRDR